MKTYTSEQLAVILAKHKAWRFGEEGGERANLQGAYLRGANLQGADLQGADLRGADLRGANLRGANLRGANLQGADLRGAYLQGANLQGAYLQGAYLQGANLQGADLQGANLQGAYLQGANLQGANLQGAVGNLKEMKSLQIEAWPVTYTSKVMQIGCQRHTLEAWWAFTEEEIARMDRGALAWWKVWGPIIKQIVEASPAVPTGAKVE